MKYQYLNEPIPQEARQELNDKILYLVDQDLAEQSGISREDIYIFVVLSSLSIRSPAKMWYDWSSRMEG